MASPLLRFYAQYAIARAIANGNSLDHAKLDGMFADAATAIDRLVERVTGITNADGTLKNLAAATAQALAGANRFSATASQTTFTTTIVWRSAFTALNVAVYSQGTKIDSSSVTVSDSGGFLRVVIPAQTAANIVFVAAYESGAGLTTDLASTANGKGASLIGIEDLAGKLAASTVEGALAELATDHDQLITDLGTLATICRTTGFTMAAAIAMGGFKITGAGAATANGELVRYEQLQAYVNSLAALAATYLPLAGGTMTGPIAMGSQRITGLGTPTDANDATTKAYVDAAVAAATASLIAPVGSIKMHGGSAVPTGWLECNGAAVSRTTYSALFAVYGTTWGVGDGTTTFNLPDLRGRSPIGIGTGNADHVTGVTITSAGSGYATAPTVTFSGGGAAVQATAEATVNAGVITAIKILTRGSGYTSTPTISFSGGGGSGGAATASIALSARSLTGKYGEESHIQQENEVGYHTHGGNIGAGANINNGGNYGIGSSYNARPEPMNVMHPTLGVMFIVKT